MHLALACAIRARRELYVLATSDFYYTTKLRPLRTKNPTLKPRFIKPCPQPAHLLRPLTTPSLNFPLDNRFSVSAAIFQTFKLALIASVHDTLRRGALAIKTKNETAPFDISIANFATSQLEESHFANAIKCQA
jgi:hypothetical protein